MQNAVDRTPKSHRANKKEREKCSRIDQTMMAAIQRIG